MKPIKEYDADGNVIPNEEFNKLWIKTKGEIMDVLENHNLTVGQAIDMLNSCSGEIRACSNRASLKEALPRLKLFQQQDEN